MKFKCHTCENLGIKYNTEVILQHKYFVTPNNLPLPCEYFSCDDHISIDYKFEDFYDENGKVINDKYIKD